MLYYLHYLSGYGTGAETEIFKGLNVFQYITFRSLAAGVTAFILCLIFGNRVIRRLVSLKLGQPIRTQEEVNRLHELHGAKAGTPTMGGTLLLGAVIVSTLLWARPTNPLVWLCLFTVIFLGGLGFVDDYLKVTKKSSDGISSRLKFALQCVLAGMITAFFAFEPSLSAQAPQLYVPFAKEPVLQNMGIFMFFLYLFVIVGSSNAVNLTDGLDGLAAGCTATVAFAFAVLTYTAGNGKIATYLQIPYVSLSGELAVVCMALVGASLGFLWWNCHPARVFMGDTGSLAIGGLLGVIAISCKQELLLALIGGVFVLEASSVILQVASFKSTGKRIFKMSPIHHHFELSGWKESTVIVRFWILSIIFALLGLATLKLR
ncbi:MAG: UDP-N-acetylmuramyl pentapeptide phosphotransferase/UDP-N-acetylglucosamine-phosphate transferase [Verrucomicrobiota bacterium]